MIPDNTPDLGLRPATRCARHASVFTPFLALAVAALDLVGCDSATDDGDNDSSVLGLWQEVDIDTAGNETLEDFWLDFAEDGIVTYDFECAGAGDVSEDCFERDEIDVVEIEGDSWSIRNVESDGSVFENTFTVQRDGEHLVLSEPDDEGGTDEERYVRSTRTDFTPLCAP